MKILVIAGDKAKVMEMEEITRLYRVTEGQVLNAIKTGHRLKTMYFDFAE